MPKRAFELHEVMYDASLPGDARLTFDSRGITSRSSIVENEAAEYFEPPPVEPHDRAPGGAMPALV